MGSARSHTLVVFGDGVETVLSTCDMSMLLQRLHLERSGTHPWPINGIKVVEGMPNTNKPLGKALRFSKATTTNVLIAPADLAMAGALPLKFADEDYFERGMPSIPA
jgi:hypothetical protein